MGERQQQIYEFIKSYIARKPLFTLNERNH